MSYGPVQAFPMVMVSGASLTPAADVGKAFESVYLEIPTMTSNTALFLQASGDNVTYRRVQLPLINTSTVGSNDFQILSSVTNRMVQIPAGFRFWKIETTATVDNGCTFKIICRD